MDNVIEFVGSHWISMVVGGVVIVAGFTVSKFFLRKRPNRPPATKKDYTKSELKAFDGNDFSKPILIAVKGKIFDVSKGELFYGPGGSYSVLAGRDASRILATMDFKTTKDSIEDIEPHEMKVLDDWLKTYEKKYEFIGNLIDG